MKDYWNGLNARERMLIGLALVLTLVIGGYQFVYKPITAWKASAERAYQRQALETHQTLEGLARLQLAEQEAKQGQTNSRESLELLLSRTAAVRGLDITRLDPAGQNGRTVWFDRVAPDLVSIWVYELENVHGLEVTSLDLRRQADAGMLRGNITVRKGNAS